jgi:dTDP-4-amino-4,6-dideoxygalactose transaminase
MTASGSVRMPFSRASLTGRELEYVGQAIRIAQLAGDQTFTKHCESLLERELGAERVLLTPSCTQALEMAALLLEIGPGDEVIVPSFTFVSVANAFVLRGAKPVFADIRRDTLNVDEAALDALITPRTKAIVVVHYAGVGCAMDGIMAVAAPRGIAVVEDTAHGLFGRYDGRPLGTIGRFGTLSFHSTKNLTCGEGGALVLNDPSDVARAEIIREKGTNRSAFFRGEVDRYTWVDLGSSYLMSDVLAAFLYAQLEAHETVQRERRERWMAYDAQLRDWAARQGVRTPVVPALCEQTYHIYYLLLSSFEERSAFIEHVGRHGIPAVFHYLPLHLSPMGRRFGGQAGDCRVAEDVSDRLVRLPLYNDMSSEEQGAVIDAVCSFT